MAIIISALALTLGLTAIGLATSVMKKIESSSDQLLQAIRNEQLEFLGDLESRPKIVDDKNDRMLEKMNSLFPVQKS